MVSIESHELEVKQKGQNNNENDLTLRRTGCFFSSATDKKILKSWMQYLIFHGFILPSDIVKQNKDGLAKQKS